MMKRFFILLLLCVALALGDISIDMQINNIKNAPAAERVRLMNAFKQRVSQMNSEERFSAIKSMQAKIRSRTQESMQSMHEVDIGQMQEHLSQREMEGSDDISQYQNMSQQQIKNLISREKMELKDGIISKEKIINQVLKIEKEEQDFKIPDTMTQRIDQLPEREEIQQVPQVEQLEQSIQQAPQVEQTPQMEPSDFNYNGLQYK